MSAPRLPVLVMPMGGVVTQVPDRSTLPEGLTSPQVAARLGVSFRRVDYVARNYPHPLLPSGQGQGNYRTWPAELVARLEVAAVLAAATGRPWPEVARAALDGDLPPGEAWAIIDARGAITYTGGTAGPVTPTASTAA